MVLLFEIFQEIAVQLLCMQKQVQCLNLSVTHGNVNTCYIRALYSFGLFCTQSSDVKRAEQMPAPFEIDHQKLNIDTDMDLYGALELFSDWNYKLLGKIICTNSNRYMNRFFGLDPSGNLKMFKQSVKTKIQWLCLGQLMLALIPWNWNMQIFKYRKTLAKVKVQYRLIALHSVLGYCFMEVIVTLYSWFRLRGGVFRLRRTGRLTPPLLVRALAQEKLLNQL